MRKLRIFEHISLDGVIAPGNDDSDYANGGWTAPFRTPEGAAAVATAQGEFDLLLGRRTYDLWSRYWPKEKGGLFADKINGATKYIATHRPASLAWGPVKALDSDPVAGVRQIKATDGRDLIIWGSTTLTSLLLDRELVDEVVLIVYPLLLGAGKRLFSDSTAARELDLIRSEPCGKGVVLNVYRHVGRLKKPDAPMQ